MLGLSRHPRRGPLAAFRRPRLRALRRPLRPGPLWLSGGRRRAVPALLALHAVSGGGSAVPAASGSGRAVERHGRALRRGQLGVRRGLPAEPDWGALLLPARHPALDARCDSCSKRGGGVWGGGFWWDNSTASCAACTGLPSTSTWVLPASQVTTGYLCSSS